jgi:MFS family permease
MPVTRCDFVETIGASSRMRVPRCAASLDPRLHRDVDARVSLRSRIPDRNIWLIYAAIFLLGLAYGLSIALVGLFLDAGGYTKKDIGSLAVWFALGIVVLSLPMGAVIRRLSARTVLIGSLFGYAAAVAAFPHMPSFGAIAGVRFFDGAFSVGVWISCETILLSRARDENKAFVTSLYAVSMACGYVVGPLLAKAIVAAAPMSVAFMVSGAVAALAAVLMLLRLDPDVVHASEARSLPASGAPAEPSPPSGSLSILWRIKTSCFATFAYGYFQASVVLFLPLYLVEQKGIATASTIVIPACFAAGMLLFSNVAGRLGDRHGHLLLMRVLAVVGTAMILGFVFLDSFVVMCAAIFVAGATLASISPLSLALQGVVTDPPQYSRANALYNVFYAAGMLLGPAVSSRIFDERGGAAMLYHLAALWAVFVMFTIVFFRDDPAARPVPPAEPALRYDS